MRMIAYRLNGGDMPRSWYNILADVPKPLDPPLDPRTQQPLTDPAPLLRLFPKALVEQEMSAVREVPIPEPVLEIYERYRPTPLFRARRLEAALDTPARIYYKYEGVSPAGSHKPNTAIPQAYYNAQEGVETLVTETGAGQWGSALALATRLFGLQARVYMVRLSYHQKPLRRIVMETYGAQVFPSPSDRTSFGRKLHDTDSPGSLGIAISEAIEDVLSDEKAKYALGSVLNHVLLHQTIIGQEAMKQMEIAGEAPTILVGAVGGGSNFGGLVLPFIGAGLRSGQRSYRVVAVEPESCPSLTKGEYRYDYGDTAGMTPLLKMHTLGHEFIPPKIHAGGLRYHGMAPIVSHLYDMGYIEARAYNQKAVFEAGEFFARTEGIIPAPEAAHAVKAVIDLAVEARDTGTRPVILFNLCGHGLLDLSAYDDFHAGRLV
ncbi:MAG: TrpB-like pyridoxal phosphate-dependent enzyme [Bacteroidia bacterium]|nr:TrpB-like pyridoxal phosphate-dependent enzyme [Bacteroidia bacterium]